MYFLCSGLGNEDERKNAPLTEALYCTSTPRAIAIRGGDRKEETPTIENEREMLMRRTSARTLNPRSSLLLEHTFQPTPSSLCGLALWPLLGPCSMYPGE